jgi:hypothetical protein
MALAPLRFDRPVGSLDTEATVLRLAWIPAYAGMTSIESAVRPSTVMPAEAGIHDTLKVRYA